MVEVGCGVSALMCDFARAGVRKVKSLALSPNQPWLQHPLGCRLGQMNQYGLLNADLSAVVLQWEILRARLNYLPFTLCPRSYSLAGGCRR